MWAFRVITVTLCFAVTKGELPEDDFRIINKQGNN